jgi:hypothetical protein
MTGAILSLMVIILDTGTIVLLQASVAVQVSVTWPLQLPGTFVTKVEELEVPVIRQLPLNPLLYVIVLAAGIKLIQVTVIFESAVIVGNAAGLTVIVLLTEANGLLHASVAVQVSVTIPPHTPGIVDNDEAFEVPEILQLPVRPLLNGSVLAAGSLPQATVVFAGAVIVGNVAGLTVIVLLTEVNALWHASVAVQVSVTIPPQGPGVAVNVEAFEVPVIWQLPVKPLS